MQDPIRLAGDASVGRGRSSVPDADPDEPSTWSKARSWLRVPPSASGVPQPVATRPQVLPVGSLAWEDFERLCLRLVEFEARTMHVSELGSGGHQTAPVVGEYGRRGQAQAGIDVYARYFVTLGEPSPTRRYLSLQARRIQDATAANIRSSVDEFLAGRWASESRTFVYATSANASSTEIVDEIVSLAARLEQESIEFAVWDQLSISRRLKEFPRLVDDFFGRAWVQEFCGASAADALGSRLAVHQVNEFRRELSRIYAATFGVADSGLIAFRFGGTEPVKLQDRFVTPDLATTTLHDVHLSGGALHRGFDNGDADDRDTLLARAAELNALGPDQESSLLESSTRTTHRPDGHQEVDRRPADQWLGTESLQVIVGDPGAGKSTILRFLVLDLLSAEPRWREVADRWGQRLPIWLPFHFFTQRVTNQTGATASVGMAIRAWLEQFDAGGIWPLVEKAIDDERLLLVVDGLDEWADDQAGQYALASLRSFAASRSTPMVVSTRPYGLDRLRLDSSWVYTRIAPLSRDQQRQLVSHYFYANVDGEGEIASREVIDRTVSDFLSQIHEVPDMRAIVGTPLFLILLVALRLSSNVSVPIGRFGVYSQAVQLLITDHPAIRRQASAVTESRQRLSDRELRILLGRIAFASQVRGDVAGISESNLRGDIHAALRDPDYLGLSTADARSHADRLIDIAEGELGILVRRGPTELGFLHRGLQEQLAAEHMVDQLDFGRLREIFLKYIGSPDWREVILATMWRLQRPTELQELVDAIRQRIDETPSGMRSRELLAEVTFGAYGLTARTVQRYAPDLIEAIETQPYAAHRARLLDSLLHGLEGETTREIVCECLERWTLLPAEPYPDLVNAIAEVAPSPENSGTIVSLLASALCYPNKDVAYASSKAIAERYSSHGPGNEDEGDRLLSVILGILTRPPSGLAASASLMALALTWRDDSNVDALLREARTHNDPCVRIVALGDAVDVLRSELLREANASHPGSQSLCPTERDWLVGLLRRRSLDDVHDQVAIACIAKAASSWTAVCDDIVASLRSDGGVYSDSDLLWPVALNILASDSRVLDVVCEQIALEPHPSLIHDLMFDRLHLLGLAYSSESAVTGKVATAIETRVGKYKDQSQNRDLYHFAEIDQGPVMKSVLLERLCSSDWPHWEAKALAEYFADDDEVMVALRDALAGDAGLASRVSNVASQVLPVDEVIPRLLEILRSLANTSDPKPRRYDLVAEALIRACHIKDIDSGARFETIAAEAIAQIPDSPRGSITGISRSYVAAAFYPSRAAREVLTEVGPQDHFDLSSVLRAFRFNPMKVNSLLHDSAKVIRTLPGWLRGRVCQALADRNLAPDIVLPITRRWADEVSAQNKSVASLAHHRALLRARQAGQIEDERWHAAKAYLSRQASCIGWDYKARRRAAWVGMCVLEEWSEIVRQIGVSNDDRQFAASLGDTIHGPDRVLLHELARRWHSLRRDFGDALIDRIFAGADAGERPRVWDSLALVASENQLLEQELEEAMAADSALLGFNGVLAWFVARGSSSPDAITEALVAQLRARTSNSEGVASILIVDPGRIGIDSEKLECELARKHMGADAYWGDPVLEALAMLQPDHSLVRRAWCRLQEAESDEGVWNSISFHFRTYIALSYASIDAADFVERILRDLDWLDEANNAYVDSALIRHVVNRLRCDRVVSSFVREAISEGNVPDGRAVQLASLLADAGEVDRDLQSSLEQRILGQDQRRLAVMARDLYLSETRPLLTILARVTDAIGDLAAR